MESRARRRVRLNRILLYAILIFTSVAMGFPFLFGIAGSFCTTRQFLARPWLPIPSDPTLENYRLLLTEWGDFWLWFANTLVRIAWYIVVPGTVAVLAGYVFARLRFRGRDTLFLLFLSSMMMPGIVYLIPSYIMVARFPGVGGNDMYGQGGQGFVGQWPSLLIVGMVKVYYIFLLRQTFYSIPRDFEEAARVDGAGFLQTMLHVYLPMLKPTITVMVIFQTVLIWNDYLWPLICTYSNPDIWTVPLGVQMTLAKIQQLKGMRVGGIFETDYPFAFATATISVLPPIALFLWLQSYFVEGVQGFAIKG